MTHETFSIKFKPDKELDSKLKALIHRLEPTLHVTSITKQRAELRFSPFPLRYPQ